MCSTVRCRRIHGGTEGPNTIAGGPDADPYDVAPGTDDGAGSHSTGGKASQERRFIIQEEDLGSERPRDAVQPAPKPEARRTAGKG